MFRVAVGICTFNRPAKLALLLEAIDHQCLTDVRHTEILIIVLDNSPGRTAHAATDAYRKRGRFAIEYRHEAKKGLSTARNRILDESLSRAERLIFVDDDEVPARGWLQSFTSELDRTGAVAAIGPVTPIFEQLPPKWAMNVAYFSKRLPSANGRVADGYTCNAIVRCSDVGRFGLRFDERFNETGGEDTMFFKALLDRKAKIVWAEKALVHEWVPSERISLSWLFRRWYRTGGVEAHLGSFEPCSWSGRLVNASRGLLRIGAGFLIGVLSAALFGWRDPGRALGRLTTLFRGAGLVGNAMGRDHREYAKASYK